MFGSKVSEDTILSDLDKFDETNHFTHVGGYYMSFATLVESRITNNLMLIGNPELCSNLGLDVASLYAELEELVVIRQKISFGKAKKETKKKKVYSLNKKV